MKTDEPPMEKLTVRVPRPLSDRAWLLRYDGSPAKSDPVRTESQVLREALAIGLAKLEKRARKRKGK